MQRHLQTDARMTGTHRRSAFASALCAMLACAAMPAMAQQKPQAPAAPQLTVSATHHAYHNAPVSVIVPSTAALERLLKASPYVIAQAETERLDCRISREGKDVRLTFLVPDLPQGTQRTYQLRSTHRAGGSMEAVMVIPRAKDLDIFMTRANTRSLFTTYTTQSGPNKPFFYPILTPTGASFTRKWPIDPTSMESHDHPHHRGLWFTHSSVNGVDYWTEQGKVGKTVHIGYEQMTGGPVYGGFRAHTEWRDPDGKLVATDTRDVRIFPLPGGDRLLDFTITIKPADGPLTFGDNKDGMFGLRLPDTLAPHPDVSAHIATPTGHIETATGQHDSGAWGKAAAWVDYYGPIGGQTYGVSIFDAPTNLRHPETWHARDYGLFTANPFALHDFHLGAKGAGDYTVPASGTLTFRYGVFFHHGDTNAAGVAARYADWADPPDVTVK